MCIWCLCRSIVVVNGKLPCCCMSPSLYSHRLVGPLLFYSITRYIRSAMDDKELHDKLKFDIRVSSMCKKAAKQLNALKRIGHLLDQSSRLTIFRAYIMSNFNYCPLVWHFCSKKKLQRFTKLSMEGPLPMSALFSQRENLNTALEGTTL